MFSREPELPKCGRKVVLRRLEKGDLDVLYTMESDLEVKRYMGGPVQPSREEWVRRMESKLPWCVTYAVVVKENLRFAGRASISPFGVSDVHREVQVALARGFQERKLGTEVCEMLICAAFHELAAEEVIGVAHPQNERSLKLLDRFGFVKVGVVEDQSNQHGHWVFSLSRVAHQSWLQVDGAAGVSI